MRIDLHSRRVQAAAGVAGFVALVAWLLPPTTPRSLPSPLLAYARIDSHRDDAGTQRRDRRVTIWSAAAWKRWYAGEAPPPPPPVPPGALPVAAAPTVAAKTPARAAAILRPRADDGGWWADREAEHRRWLEQRREDDRLWRESLRGDGRNLDRRAERDDDGWADGDRMAARPDRAEARTEPRTEQRRDRIIERRMRRFPDDDPYYDPEYDPEAGDGRY